MIDCEERAIFVHRLDVGGHYGAPARIAANETAEALLIPGLKLRLDDHKRLR